MSGGTRSRRQFLADLLFAGGALSAAALLSQLAQAEPPPSPSPSPSPPHIRGDVAIPVNTPSPTPTPTATPRRETKLPGKIYVPPGKSRH